MRKIIAVALISALALCAVGCKKNIKDEAEEGSAGSIVVLEENSEIKLATVNAGTLNPLETTSRSIQSIMNIVYEPLFTVDEKLNAIPVLAESYSLSEDGRRITVKLRDDIKWHDGAVFTADDVSYTLSKLKASNGFYKKTADKISSYRVMSADEIEINLKGQELNFVYYLTFPILSKNTNYTNDFDFVPIGTGSYKYGSKSENEIELLPNAAWHEEPVAQKRILVKLLRDDNEVSQAFNVNETDAILSEETDKAENPPKSSSQMKEIVSENMVFLGFNTQNPLLSQDIRRAISIVLDKPKLLEKTAYGYGRVCDISVNPDSWAYEGVQKSDYSWESVVKMLEDAGYKLKDNVYSSSGQILEYEMLVNSEKPQRVAIAEAVAEMLTGAGFVTKVKALAYSEYIERIKNGDFDIFLGVTQTETSINPIVLLDSDSNYFNFDARELVQMKSALYGVTDKEEYKKTVKAIASKFMEDPPYIPLFFTTCGVYYGANVSGMTNPTLSDRYKDIEKWYFYSNTQNEDKKSE